MKQILSPVHPRRRLTRKEREVGKATQIWLPLMGIHGTNTKAGNGEGQKGGGGEWATRQLNSHPKR